MPHKKMPLVAFSHDIFTGQIAGGVTRCMIELMRAVTGLGLDWSAWAGRNDNIMLREAMAQPWAYNNICSMQSRHRGRILASVLQEPAFATWVNNKSPSVVHRTYYPIRDMVAKRFPHVETLHDLWDERSRTRNDNGAKFRSFIKKRACHQADAVICVSEHTRDEAVDRWPSLAHKITVIPHGVRRLSVAPVEPAITRPYFLFVGRRGSYKNFVVVADALMRSGLEHRLVCFGGGPFSSQEQRTLVTLNISDRTEQISGSDDQLAGLYMEATALLYPSSFEGFGLPLLEAMIHQCPVISSPLTSLPEVGGDAVLYADPQSPDSWADAMQRVVYDTSLADGLRVSGQHRATQFSWTRSAELHRQLYRSLV
jgi:glycosyltransferase involved in cell wall biosynthesis